MKSERLILTEGCSSAPCWHYGDPVFDKSSPQPHDYTQYLRHERSGYDVNFGVLYCKKCGETISVSIQR